MQIKTLAASDAALLQNFLESHPYGGIEQSWAWGELQTRIPGRDHFFVLGLFEADKLIGSMLLIRQTMGFGKTWLWAPHGPVLPLGEQGERAWDLLRHELGKWGLRCGDVFVRWEPGVPAVSPLIPQGKAVKESYLPRHSLELDLNLKEEELLAQMAQKGRYNIKKAAKSGVTVRAGKAKDMPAFYEILKETSQRDGFHVHSRAFYEAFVETLGTGADFWVAEVEGEMVGGVLMTYFGKRATYYFGASSNKYRESMAPYALQWHAILAAKKKGFERYDFLGIAPENDAAHPLKGVTQFKTRFGGLRTEVHPAQVLVLRPLWWFLYRVAKRLR